MKRSHSLTQLGEGIQTAVEQKLDLLVQPSALRADTMGSLIVNDEASERYFGMTEVAHQQMAALLGSNMKFYRKLYDSHPDVWSHAINEIMPTVREPRMVRTLDGKARAILSNIYRRIDDDVFTSALIQALGQNGEEWQFESGNHDPFGRTRIKVAFTSPRFSGEVKKGDVVQWGIHAKNSEVGLGYGEIWAFVKRLVCDNGMTITQYFDGVRLRHAGVRLAIEEDADSIELSQDTLFKEEQLLQAKIRDAVRALASPNAFDRWLSMATSAAEDVPDIRAEKAVEVLAARHRLNEGERSGVLQHLIEGGDLSRWGYANAITRAASDVGSYERASELEAIGGEVAVNPRALAA
jgi:hypothetical protein